MRSMEENGDEGQREKAESKTYSLRLSLILLATLGCLLVRAAIDYNICPGIAGFSLVPRAAI